MTHATQNEVDLDSELFVASLHLFNNSLNNLPSKQTMQHVKKDYVTSVIQRDYYLHSVTVTKRNKLHFDLDSKRRVS